MKTTYKMVRLTKGVHKELVKAVDKRSKSLDRNVTMSELIGDMIRQGSWSK